MTYAIQYIVILMNRGNGIVMYINISTNEEPEKMSIIQEELYIRIITQLIAFFKEKRWGAEA